MIRSLAQHWWVLLLRGLLAIAFGVLTYARPGLTILLLVTFWGAYALVDGIFEVIAGVRAKWGSLVFLGVIGIAAGIVALLRPGLTAVALIWVLAFWAIIAGVMQISAAIRLRKEVQGEWLWILSGALTIALGVLFLARPGEGILSVTWLIATLAIVWGILLVMLSFRLKAHHGRLAAKAA